LTELNDLEKAIKAPRFNGRIEAIRKAFETYKKAIGNISTWGKIKAWFKIDEA